MVRVPTIAEEDAKRPNRERECLVGERTRIVNRMKATLARLGIRNFKPTLRRAAERLATVHTPEGMPLPPERLAGVLSCYDRIIVTGTLPGACYAKGMTGFLSARQIRIFDYPRFAEPLRDRVRERAAELASAAGITIEHIAKNHIRKEDVVARVLVVRGDRPGLVHIISAMEACDTYKPWHDKHTHRTFLRPDTGKCLHYYFYFIDAELGLIYLRVPTWCPFRLQFY